MTPLRRLLVSAMVGLLVSPAMAHHSASAEFDMTKPITVKGVVTKVEWTNPHIWFYVDVQEPDGTVTHWGFSAGPPGSMRNRGVSREALKPGTVIVVQGFRARDGSNNANGASVKFEDGRSVFVSGN